MAVAEGSRFEARALPFRTAPALTGLCLLATTVDLILNRILIRIWGDAVSHQQLLSFDQGGAFFRNLAAVSGFIAVAIALSEFTFRQRAVPLSGRIGVAAFSAAFLPLIALIIIMPSQWTRMELVLITAGLAHALMILIGLIGLRWHSNRSLTAGLLLVIIASFFGIASLLIHLLGHVVGWGEAERWAGAVRYAGEVCYLVGLIVAGGAALPRWRTARGKAVAVLGGFVAAAVATAVLIARFELGPEFETVFYGALRLDLFIDAPVVYAVLLGLAAALGVSGLFHPTHAGKQIGAGVLLLVAAGYAPRSPVLLVVTLLGISLLARAALSLGLGDAD